MNRPEKKFANKVIQKKEMEFIQGKVTGTIDLITHCLVQLNVQVLCNYTRGI
jgi:hypothetical protein